MKKLTALLLMLLMVAAMVPGASAEITLEYWSGLTGGDAAYMDEIVTNFNNSNTSGITVKSNVMKADEMLAKLVASTSANAGMPDAIFFGVGDVPLHVQNGLLIPMDDLLEPAGFDMSQIPQNYTDVVRVDGKLYLMPIEVHPWVMFYNKTLLEQVGYQEEDILTMDIDKMVEIMDKVVALGDDYYGLSLSGADNAVFVRLFDSALFQAGAPIFSQEDEKAVFNTPEAVEAVSQYIRLGKYTVPKGTSGRPVFVSGKALFHFNGVWEQSQLDNDEVKAVLNWGVVPFPKLVQPEKVVWADLGGISITKANDSPEKQAAVMEFVKYVQDNALIFCQAGHLPVTQSLLASEEFKTHLFYNWKDSAAEFTFPPATAGYPVFLTQAGPEFTMLYWGEKTDVQATMDEAVNTVNELVENQ